MEPIFFGRAYDADIFKYVLRNQQDTQVGILNLGGIIQEFSVMKNGARRQLVIALDDAESYVRNPFQINKQIGRVAGRIENASFDLFGQHCQVEANNGKHALHGGSRGLGEQVLAVEHYSAQELVLSATLKQEVDGYPNQLKLRICYVLTDDNRLEISYHAQAVGDTVFDPTLHIYFSLPENLRGADLHIPNGQYVPVDADKLPQSPMAVAPTAYDFSQAKALDKAVAQLREQCNQMGFDEVYQVQPSLTEPVAVLNVAHEYRVRLFSDRNGLVLFTAYPTDISIHDSGVYNALATEVQTIPNSLHRAEFGEIRLRDGESKMCHMIFQVEVN